MRQLELIILDKGNLNFRRKKPITLMTVLGNLLELF